MKVFSIVLAAALVVAAGFTATPAGEQTVKEQTCSEVVGTNSLSYDCQFRVNHYDLGGPVTFAIEYSCSGACGPVLSFGLRDEGFSPAGVTGHMLSGRRLANGLELTFAFDTLQKQGSHAVGDAHFVMNLMVDDGQGGSQLMPCAVDVHLKSAK